MVSGRQEFFERPQLPRLTGALAVAPLAHPGRNTIEPRSRVGAPFELIPLPERQKERVLDEVPGLVVIAAEAKPERIKASAVAFHELGHGDVGGSVLEHVRILAHPALPYVAGR